MYWIGYTITLIALVRYLRTRMPGSPLTVIAGSLALALFWVPILVLLVILLAVRNLRVIGGCVRRLGARWSAISTCLRDRKAVPVYGQEG